MEEVDVNTRAGEAEAEANALATAQAQAKVQELALTLARQGRYSEAEVQFEDIVRANPEGAVAQWAYSNLGGVLIAQQKWAAAESTLRIAHSLYHQTVHAAGGPQYPQDMGPDWHEGFDTVNRQLARAVRQQGRFINHALWGQTRLDPRKTVSFIQTRAKCGSDLCSVCGQNIWGEYVHHAPYAIHHHYHYIHHYIHTSYIIHHTSYSIHHTSYIIHHTPYTIHHTPYTIHHTPYRSTVYRTIDIYRST
jgi:tetratricopeptide (TPR) repeat protein